MAIVKIPSRSRVMTFSNNRLLFLLTWERGFSIGNGGTGEPSTLHHEQMTPSEEINTLITLWLAYGF